MSQPNRLDNLQIVFDRTDWAALRKQKRNLILLLGMGESRNRDFDELLNWLDMLEAAAKMDGYQTKKEPTR